jgi:hypothetical protein
LANLEEPASDVPAMASGDKIGLVLFGGIVLGVWIYGLLFGFPEWRDFAVSSWFFWGFLGMILASGIYAARATEETSRLIIISVLGIVITVVILGATLNENLYVFATLATVIGGGMILAAVPVPGQSSEPQPRAEN